MKQIFILCCISIFFSVSSFAQKDDFSFQKKFNVKDDVQLKVKTNDGFIHVTPSDDNVIQVFFIVERNNHLLRMDRRELEEEMDVIIEQYQDEVEIMIRQKRKNMFVNWRNQINVSLEITAPASTTCDLHSSDGNIRISEMEADQYCRTSDGDIKAFKIGGEFIGHTSDGDITVEDIDGYCKLETSDGDISAEYVIGKGYFTTSDGDIDLSNVKGNVYTHTSDGDISFRDLSGSIESVTSDGDIRGNMISVDDDISLSTSDGSIELTIPEGLGLDLRLKSEKIRSNLSGFFAKSEGRIQRSINGGGILIDIHSSDGGIYLYDTNKKQRD